MLTEWAQHLTDALEAAPEPGAEPTTRTSELAPAPAHRSDAGGTEPAGLAVDGELINLVLDLARDAAHAVDRPAAPLTTFLVGFAAGRMGGGRRTVEHLAATARTLAEAWERDDAAGGGKA